MPPRSESTCALVALREAPLSVDEVLDAVRDPASGAVVVFIGVVRDHDHGVGVDALDYSAHPSALDRRLAAVHRIGALTVGDLAVVVAASAPHRGEAFAAARDLIDTLKAEVPIWKHQGFADGSTEWVGLP